jgi:hypothetical protein
MLITFSALDRLHSDDYELNARIYGVGVGMLLLLATAVVSIREDRKP